MLEERRLDIVNVTKSLTLLIFGISMVLPAMGSNHEQSTGRKTPVDIGGATESSIDGISIISPVTQSNFDAVMAGMRQRGSLRELTAVESNTLVSAVPTGTYFYAYGFQLMTTEDSSDFMVSHVRGTDWHHFELHKQTNGETVLLGIATSNDAGKLEYYSKRYGPTPKLVPQPIDDFNVLLILPLRLLGKIDNHNLQLGVGEVTALDAALLPKK